MDESSRKPRKIQKERVQHSKSYQFIEIWLTVVQFYIPNPVSISISLHAFVSNVMIFHVVKQGSALKSFFFSSVWALQFDTSVFTPKLNMCH